MKILILLIETNESCYIEKQKKKLNNEKTTRRKNILEWRTNNIKFKRTLKNEVAYNLRQRLEERK